MLISRDACGDILFQITCKEQPVERVIGCCAEYACRFVAVGSIGKSGCAVGSKAQLYGSL